MHPEWHHGTGLAPLFGVCLLPIGGILVQIYLNTLRWNTAFVLKMKLGHKVLLTINNLTLYL
jgi:hypothetical protein